jgi:hypothetical protein
MAYIHVKYKVVSVLFYTHVTVTVDDEGSAHNERCGARVAGQSR